MTYDMQRARELICKFCDMDADDYDDEMAVTGIEAVEAITAALRAAPDAELHAAAEDFYNTVATQAAANELQKSVPSWGLVVTAGARLHLALLNQNGVTVVADSSQVVPPPALGAHEVHPEAVDVGLDLGKSGERLLAADALEHGRSVSPDREGFATAPEGPATHYHCKDGIHGTVRRLRRYSTTAINRNSLQGQTMEEAAAFIEHVLAARPQGVKDV